MGGGPPNRAYPPRRERYDDRSMSPPPKRMREWDDRYDNRGGGYDRHDRYDNRAGAYHNDGYHGGYRGRGGGPGKYFIVYLSGSSFLIGNYPL